MTPVPRRARCRARCRCRCRGPGRGRGRGPPGSALTTGEVPLPSEWSGAYAVQLWTSVVCRLLLVGTPLAIRTVQRIQAGQQAQLLRLIRISESSKTEIKQINRSTSGLEDDSRRSRSPQRVPLDAHRAHVRTSLDHAGHSSRCRHRSGNRHATTTTHR